MKQHHDFVRHWKLSRRVIKSDIRIFESYCVYLGLNRPQFGCRVSQRNGESHGPCLAHLTPLHIALAMDRHCRQVNDSCYTFASSKWSHLQIFCASTDMSRHFTLHHIRHPSICQVAGDHLLRARKVSELSIFSHLMSNHAQAFTSKRSQEDFYHFDHKFRSAQFRTGRQGFTETVNCQTIFKIRLSRSRHKKTIY
jgi:hypothetical protein